MWSLYQSFAPEQARRILDKIEWHYTPEHGSWLNMAEIELSVMQRQCLDRRIPDVETLECEVHAWCAQRNYAPVTITWQFTTKDARIKLKSLYPVISLLAVYSVHHQLNSFIYLRLILLNKLSW